MKISDTTTELFFDFLANFYADLNDKHRMQEIEVLINTAPDAQKFLDKLKVKIATMEID